MDPMIRKLRFRLLAWLHRSRSGPILFVKKFSYKDVKRATDGFHRIVYSNSHGAAYKARFEGGEVALVKEQELSTKEKRASIEKCSSGAVASSPSSCAPGIFHREQETPLNWKARLQIAVGVAAALEYLLLFSNPPVYHVSINSSNIMLDENFTAKVTDVGLLSSIGTYVQMPHSSCSEECMGQERGNIVFQLGVLILELITGQSSGQGGTDLIQWVQGSRLSSSIDMMIDPDLGTTMILKSLRIF
ncbi:senescence-associated family protein [Hibiscus syriacus]|uniref:Senescence-associated family protein n=1 Tax=Hibiscus syriacus TaxID=106335 RepID=A0A6A3D0Z1_HIBSY|nr:senescence-associated family protein [Hibiscus syriacus]